MISYLLIDCIEQFEFEKEGERVMAGNNTYDAGSIAVLEGLEAVRKRPGMYIGSVSTKGLNHLIYEIVDNAVDEHLAGFCSEIQVTLEKDGSATVSDNGRGVPVDMHQKGVSAARLVYTTLHAGGKFDDSAYKTSGGLHGVGSSVVNALSTYMDVKISRDGFVHHDRYERGIPVIELEDGLLPKIGKTRKTGTTVNFLPDDTIFEKTKFKAEEVKSRLHETAYLNPNLTIVFDDKRDGSVEHIVYHEPEGIIGFIQDLNRKKEVLHDPVYFKGEADGIEVEVTLQYVNEFHENVLGFCNNIYNAEGGTHLTGFKTTFTTVMNQYAREIGILKEKDANFTGAKWAVDAGLYEDESSDELYKKALDEEGGKVVIYSISSRMAKVKASFEEDYPGMTLEVYDINANDMSTKLSTEYNSGIRTADVIHSKEQTGDYMINFFNKGILHNYQPESIYKNVNQEYLKDMTPLYFETDWWFCNTGIYTETPITNWWDVTEPEWKGSFVLQNPIGTVSYMALFTTMVEHADEMAEAYKACYGEDIVLADDEPTAAHAWMKRVLENDPVIFDSNNEVIQSVGEGKESKLIGYTPSSKYRERADKGWNIESEPLKMEPVSGVAFMNFVAVVNEAPHPNGAKLLIRYLLGGEDGNGNGIKPFNTIGGWPVRPETTPAEGNIPLEDMKLWMINYDFVYKNLQDVQDYWYQFR